MAREGGALAVRVRVAGPTAERPRVDVDVSFGVGLTAVMGPSGAGKTSLLLAIAGLVRPLAGRITLGGSVLFDGSGSWVPPHRRRMALVFQHLALFPHLTAWQNVAYGVPRRSDGRDRAREWLARTRVAHVAERLPSTLSGGEAQRVALARALAAEPGALLLDEPFSSLDGRLRLALGDELKDLVEALQIPAVLVTHHLEDAQRLAARVVELEAGRLRSERPEGA
ncbi:MAG: ATP-binding cassette domain-containing protein [Myxococcaceae bacterium]|jgi:molybdate transport system ATP-binding protein|nr:ATP-binding cassette domain-containing protein [Myxococcaceae bacterium]MCA3015738.1 ATP-binding cassette domain-containing protein [Myxococcaceae bacterium]